MKGTCIIPVDLFRNDPYFSKEKHVYSRAEALSWIGANVRCVDNCTLKKWQETWSLRTLADAWGWTVKRVRCFLEACEKRGLIGTSLGHIKGTAQIVITYLVQALNWSNESDGAQVGAQQGHSRGTSYETRRQGYREKKDSRAAHSARFGFPDAEDVLRATAEPDPSSDIPGAAEAKPSTPRRERARADKSPHGYSEEFERLWATFPDRSAGKGGKAPVYAKWLKLTPLERGAALEGAERWRENAKTQDPQYVAMPSTWMNQRRWETEPAPKARAKEEAWGPSPY